MPPPNTILITAAVVAERLHKSVSTLANWRSRRTGPTFIKLGGSVLYRESDIEKYITRSEVEPEYRSVGPRETIPIPKRSKAAAAANMRFGGHLTRAERVAGQTVADRLSRLHA